ncbi:MAG: Rieske 2Fe-2S domain-containing protein [Devosia sp.]
MAWIPIALSRDVPEGTTRGVIVEGREYVVWRGASGSAQVWEDRCPHRGMRLSFGFVRGNSLNCLYHGWQYDAESRCRHIPAHPDLVVPSSIRANVYKSVENGGMIWLGASDDNAYLPVLSPRLPLASIAVEAGGDNLPALGERPFGEGAQLLVLERSGLLFYIGWHQVDAARMMLHVALADNADAERGMAALRGLRYELEAEAGHVH